jgi:hypothetical protein
MKHVQKDKLPQKNYPMFKAEKLEKETMENPVEQNSKNESGIPKSTQARQEKNKRREQRGLAFPRKLAL